MSTKKPAPKRAVPSVPVKKPHGKIIEPHHIEAVKKFLPRGMVNALTMRALGRKMKCSKGAAERRFNAYLEKTKGFEKIKSCQVREGERGPSATGFYL